MSLTPYFNIETSSNYQVYEFISDGKEKIRKRIRFDLIDEVENIYNLALCTILPDEIEDCHSPSRNGDMDKVLETAAHIALIYTERYPDHKIFFQGSDAARSRKYQIGVNKYLEIMMKTFFIEGIVVNKHNNIILKESFQRGRNYTGFIFSRKK